MTGAIPGFLGPLSHSEGPGWLPGGPKSMGEMFLLAEAPVKIICPTTSSTSRSSSFTAAGPDERGSHRHRQPVVPEVCQSAGQRAQTRDSAGWSGAARGRDSQDAPAAFDSLRNTESSRKIAFPYYVNLVSGAKLQGVNARDQIPTPPSSSNAPINPAERRVFYIWPSLDLPGSAAELKI